MKVIKLTISAASDGEVVSGSLTTQRKRGDTWIVEDVITVISGQPGAERTMVLDDTQRLLIEGTSNTEVVYDKEQSAAVIRPVERPQASPSRLNTDGDEDTGPSLVDESMRGPGLTALQEQERRDRAITEARQKLEEQRKIDAEKAEAERQRAIGSAPTNPLPSPHDLPVTSAPRPTPPFTPKPKVQF